MPSLIRTRFAPTPSGYLHIGNAWSFLITWLLARSQGGKIHLRIDDLDAARFREEYLEDIFASLSWLGLDWDSGPKNPVEFHSSFSQRLRRSEYRSALDSLIRLNSDAETVVYACRCSRKQIKGQGQAQAHAHAQSFGSAGPGIYPGTCRSLNLPPIPAPLWQSGKSIETPSKKTALRLFVPSNTTVTLSQALARDRNLSVAHPGHEMGDIVLWQKNGEAAYQLASVVDDEALGINCVVRGRDLQPSSGVQAFLAGLLGAKTVANATFFHHGLWLGPEGEKLSKSSGGQPIHPAFTLRYFREKPGGRELLLRAFSKHLRLEQDGFEPEQMLSQFNPARLTLDDLTHFDNLTP